MVFKKYLSPGEFNHLNFDFIDSKRNLDALFKKNKISLNTIFLEFNELFTKETSEKIN